MSPADLAPASTEAAPGAGDALPTAVSPPLEWSCNPWRERPLAAGLALLAGVGLWVLCWSLGESPLLALALGAAGLAALSPLLVPVACRVDGEGLARRGLWGWQRRRWSEIRRGARLRGGVLVSPYGRAHFLDAYRGLFLPLPGRGRAPLAASLERWLGLHGL